MANFLKDAGIVITRPAEQAKKLSSLVTAEGGKPILFPLIDIVPLVNYETFDHTIASLKSYDWAIFISSNAVQNGMPRVLQRFPQLPENLKLAAIGPVTANELTHMTGQQVLIPEGRFDSESLLSLPEMQSIQGQKVMIFRGMGGREVLADTLSARGADVTFAECYRRINPQSTAQPLEQLWQNGECQAVVVTSSEAMRHLLQMTNNGTAAWLQNIAICVNHARIAEEALAASNKLNVHIADAPGDPAMLACLQRALSPASSHS